VACFAGVCTADLEGIAVGRFGAWRYSGAAARPRATTRPTATALSVSARHQHHFRIAPRAPAWCGRLLATRHRRRGLAHFCSDDRRTQAGVEITREQDPAKADDIEAWIDQVTATYNILPADPAIFRRWAQFMRHSSEALNEDAMIAATAEVHDLTVVTRNVRDFRPFAVKTFNPFP
jgi:hypothetical protein